MTVWLIKSDEEYKVDRHGYCITSLDNHVSNLFISFENMGIFHIYLLLMTYYTTPWGQEPEVMGPIFYSWRIFTQNYRWEKKYDSETLWGQYINDEDIFFSNNKLGMYRGSLGTKST